MNRYKIWKKKNKKKVVCFDVIIISGFPRRFFSQGWKIYLLEFTDHSVKVFKKYPSTSNHIVNIIKI